MINLKADVSKMTHYLLLAINLYMGLVMLTYMQELHIHKVIKKKKEHSLNNPEKVKECWKQALGSQ